MGARLDIEIPGDKLAAEYQKVQREAVKLRTENQRLQGQLEKMATATRSTGASLGESLQAIRDPLMRLQAGLAQASKAFESGKINQEQYRNEVQRLRAQFEGSASPLEKYTQRLADAQENLRRGKISGATYEQQLRELRGEFATSTEAADRYKAQIAALDEAKRRGAITTEEYTRAMEEAGEETQSLMDNAPAGLNSITQSLAALVTGSLSVGAIVSQIRAAMEEAKALREEQNRKQMDVGEAQGETLKMLGAVETPEAEKFLSSVQQVGEDTKFKDMTQLYLAAADTLSATAGDQEMTLAILKQAAPLFKNRPDQISEFAGAVADLATIQGAKSDEEIKGVISTVLSTTGQARITSLSGFKEIARGIAGAVVSDTSGEKDRAIAEAGAVAAAIGGAIKDPNGAMTGTATSGLASQLERLLPEKDIVESVSDERRAELLDRQAKTREKLAGLEAGGESDTPAANLAREQLKSIDQQLAGVVRRGTGLRTMSERMQAVQQDVNLQRQFFEGDASQNISAAAFEGPVKPVIRELLTNPQSESAQRFQTAQRAITSDTSSYDQMVRNLQEASPQIRLQQRSSEAESLIENYDLRATEAGNREAIDKQVNDALDRARSTEGLLTRWTLGSQQSVQASRAAAMDDDQANRFNIARLIMRREEIAGEGVRGRGLATEKQREINRYVGSEDQLTIDQLRKFASISSSPEDQTRLAKLDEEERKSIQLLDQMVQTLLRIADSNAEMADREVRGPQVGASAAAAVPSSQRLSR
jgi:predicted  nucleic acid-binding Zn-ribbon protein